MFKFKIFLYLFLGILVLSSLLLAFLISKKSLVLAVNTCDSGWQINVGETKPIDCHQTCRKITNACSAPIFIPTATSSEWQQFLTNRPSCIFPVTDCPPPSPSNVSCTTLSSSEIKVSWDSVSKATYYEIYYCSGSNSCTPSTYLAQTSNTSYTHSGLSAGTTYRYKVKACNEGGCSQDSNITTCTTSSGGGGEPPPEPPPEEDPCEGVDCGPCRGCCSVDDSACCAYLGQECLYGWIVDKYRCRNDWCCPEDGTCRVSTFTCTCSTGERCP